MRIAIIGAGIGGLACAHECERLGVRADVYERDSTVGWNWSLMNVHVGTFFRMVDNPVAFARQYFGISLKPSYELRKVIMKSPNQKVVIEGDLGYSFVRGKDASSIENQLLRDLKQTTFHFSSLADFEKLSKEYDYVIVASGKDHEAAQLGVWEDYGQISMVLAEALGDFDPVEHHVFYNTDYAGTGYARVGPFSKTKAIIDLYVVGHGPFQMEERFSRFLKIEGLENLEFLNTSILPVFQTGRVKKFQVDNILLVGRAAGLTERLIGLGIFGAVMSGVYAARAVIKGEDYEEMVKPLQEHKENISALRKAVDKFDNNDFDTMLTMLGTPGIKQLVYNTKFNVTEVLGAIINKIYPSEAIKNKL